VNQGKRLKSQSLSPARQKVSQGSQTIQRATALRTPEKTEVGGKSEKIGGTHTRLKIRPPGRPQTEKGRSKLSSRCRGVERHSVGGTKKRGIPKGTHIEGTQGRPSFHVTLVEKKGERQFLEWNCRGKRHRNWKSTGRRKPEGSRRKCRKVASKPVRTTLQKESGKGHSKVN